MASPFSRLQLAAALLEYDNDPTDPNAHFHSAAESAIFAQFRRNDRPRSIMSRKSADYLGVSLPSEKGSSGGREAMAMDNGETRRSRSSIDMLRNPFGAADEDLDEEDELEVDLESWGLDNLLSKDKGKEPQKRAKLPNPHPLLNAPGPRRPMAGARAKSMGDFDEFGDGGAFLDAKSSLTLPLPSRREEFVRPRSLSTPLQLAGTDSPDKPLPRGRRQSDHVVIQGLPVTPPLHSVPFPSSSRLSGPVDDVPDNVSSYFDPQPHQRTQSTTSFGSRMILNDDPGRSASPGRRSRFDSLGNPIRTVSTMAPSTVSADENNPFALRPPSPSRSSRFDPKAAAHGRTTSNASLGSRLILDDAATGATGLYSRDRLQSRFDLLRPKVLIMPSPLQHLNKPPPEPKVRDGFQITDDGPPLPPGARSASKSAVLMSVQPEGLVASNSFTPNPRSSLSLAQLTFRSTLHGGTKDTGYSDLDNTPQCVTEEGEQVQLPESPTEAEPPVIRAPMEDGGRNSRVPGKLYGRSLIDDLESRKAEMRGKRRVFRGDERPSMMARSTTFIDPSSLQRTGGQQEGGASLGRRNTLLNFDEPDKGGAKGNARKPQPALVPRASNVKTVFGVDTLWEREMVKLREMEALERKQAGLPDPEMERSLSRSLTDVQASALPYTTPMTAGIRRPSVKKGPPPRVTDDDDSDDVESDVSEVYKTSQRNQNDDHEWFSDEEKAEPVRTVGSGPRYPRGNRSSSKLLSSQTGDDSEEDVPLAATVNRAIQRATRLKSMDDDSDEDKPLNALLDKTKLKLPPMSFEDLSTAPKGVEDNKDDDDDDEDEDDDKPLGLKANRSRLAGDEDDQPLAFHPGEQQRRTQYQMMAQQQQYAQQQIMMQAQFQNPLMFATPSMMGSGFFGSPLPPPILAAQIPIPMAAPPEANKFGRVDRWRHDVAVEGET